MKKTNQYSKIMMDGIFANNPTFKLALGMCATLALTTSAMNGLGMGLTVTIILTLSNLIISCLRKVIPSAVRIPAFVVVIATLVTLVRMILEKYIPDLYDSMGVFLPLIVVNCLILARAEAFASKNTPVKATVDGMANGLGFTLGLVIISLIREVLGAGKIFGLKLWSFKIEFFTSPAGAFFVYGICIAVFIYFYDKIIRNNRRKLANLPQTPLSVDSLEEATPQTPPQTLAKEEN